MNLRKVVATALIVLGALATLPTLAARYVRETEQQARPVDLVLELKSYRLLAQQEGVPLQDLLADMHQAGATAVAVSEDDIESLQAGGQVSVVSGGELQAILQLAGQPHPVLQQVAAPGNLRGSATYLVSSQREVFDRLQKALTRRLPGRVRSFTVESPSPLYILEADAPKDQLAKLGFGFNPADMKLVEAAGLRVLPRPRNIPDATPEEVAQYFADLMQAAPSTQSIVFEGAEVLGYPKAVAATAAALDKYHLRLDLIENAEQRGYIIQAGQEELAQAVGWRVTRLFGITQAYEDKLGPAGTADTWIRGVIDRNIHAVYMRPWFKDPLPGKTVVQTNVAETQYIAHKLVEDGYSVGLGGYYRSLTTRLLIHLAQAMGVVGGALLWLLWIWPSGNRLFWGLAVLGVAGAGFLAWYGQRGHLVGFELLALGAACIYPALAMTAIMRRWAGKAPLLGEPGELEKAGAEGLTRLATAWSRAGARWGRTLVEGLRAVLVLSGISALGGFLVASLMGDIRFMLEFGYFLGVKAAFSLPLLLGVLSYVMIGRQGNPKRVVADLRKQARAYLSLPLTYGYVLLGLVGLVALFWYVQRSGNNPLVPVPQWELQMRDWFERVLVARPREKEIFIGYPLLMLGAAFWVRGLRSWLLPFLLAAGTGAISVVNSFSHIRTGVAIAGLRWLNGLAVGVPVSLVLTVAILVVLDLFARLELREAKAAGKGKRA